jgi:hypothetical protein
MHGKSSVTARTIAGHQAKLDYLASVPETEWPPTPAPRSAVIVTRRWMQSAAVLLGYKRDNAFRLTSF